MAQPERPLLADLREQIGSFGADLRQVLLLRWQLARMEAEAAVAQIKRLAIALLVFGAMLLTALPILAVAAAWSLADPGGNGISFGAWLLIFGLGLLIGGGVGGWLAWRRFRRRFTGIEQTLEELREDGVWLQQWVGRGEDSEEW